MGAPASVSVMSSFVELVQVYVWQLYCL